LPKFLVFFLFFVKKIQFFYEKSGLFYKNNEFFSVLETFFTKILSFFIKIITSFSVLPLFWQTFCVLSVTETLQVNGSLAVVDLARRFQLKITFRQYPVALGFAAEGNGILTV
jgi:hypothetical protein